MISIQCSPICTEISQYGQDEDSDSKAEVYSVGDLLPDDGDEELPFSTVGRRGILVLFEEDEKQHA